jgi:chromosome segregation ATPase
MSKSTDGQDDSTNDEIVARALERYGRKRQANAGRRDASQASRFTAIERNTFHELVFTERDADRAREAVATQLAYDRDLDRDANRGRLVEFEHFRAWLMAQRTDMAQQVIQLTDTDAFSQLKNAIDEMNRGMLDFEQQMQPLTEILDAVYRLRVEADADMADILQEIQEDRAEEARLQAERETCEAAQQRLQARIDSLREEIEREKLRRTWFGLGRIKEAAQKRIAEIEREIEDQMKEIEANVAAMNKVAAPRETRFGGFAEEKARLRELLDISSEEHRERQKALVDSANAFVSMAQSRTTAVLTHLEGINARIEHLGEANGRLREAYAILTEAVHEAEARNSSLRDELLEGPEQESSIASLQRTNLRMTLENHVSALSTAKIETLETYGDLTAEGYRIKAIRDANQTQVARAHALSSKGVAEVASRLSTVLQGVSTAALAESSDIARQTLARMNQQTTRFTHKEALKNAMGISADNDALVHAIEELEGYAKIARAATAMSREGLIDLRENLGRLERTLTDVVDAVSEATAVSAEVIGNERREDPPRLTEKDSG